MSAGPPKAVKAPSPTEPLSKAWKRTAPLRKVLAWCFILHGSIRLGTDFWNLREPFVLSDVSEWWQWMSERVAELRGVKVKVEG